MKGYFRNIWNVVDTLSFLLTLFVIIHTLFDLTYINVREMRTVAAFASFFLVLKLYDWLRLFEKTAFYVRLLSMTLQGIGYFMLLLGIGLLLFGIPLSMISLNRILDD